MKCLFLHAMVIMNLLLEVHGDKVKSNRQQRILAILESFDNPSPKELSDTSLASPLNSIDTPPEPSLDTSLDREEYDYHIDDTQQYIDEELSERGDESNNIGNHIPTLPPILNTWVTLDTQSFLRQTTQPPSTTQPTWSQYELWYYQDTSGYVQGPFTADTMLNWDRAGYFRY